MTVAPSSRAVVERRRSPVDALDLFPTPPWATRALLEWIVGHSEPSERWCCWEPAAGLGHMAEVLAEKFDIVYASDVHDYGLGHAIGSFVGQGLDVARVPYRPDWIITNPPFALGEAFLDRALDEADRVALLLRTNWIDSEGRFERIFSRRAPTQILQFAERVPMVEGRWEPAATTATPYAWFVWRRDTCELFREAARALPEDDCHEQEDDDADH